MYDKIKQASDFIMGKIHRAPKVAVILGSGLGEFANQLDDAVEIKYSEIPNFPTSTVVGHSGKLVFGSYNGVDCLAMAGRFHYYEGYTMREVTFPISVFAVLGCKNLIVTTSCGGVNEAFSAGDLMLICDHIKLTVDSPLRGEHVPEIGNRFTDMSNVYDLELREIARSVGIEIKEGVFGFMGGPSYETPAEVRMLRILGVDAVSMSTVPEVIVAVNAGMKVLGISCITNMAAGILDKPLSHEEVIEGANAAKEKFIKLLGGVIEKL